MRRNRKRRLIKSNLISLFLIVAIMSGLALSIYYSKTSQTMIAQSYYENERTVTTTQPLIIIDAGHGGIDPGSDSQGILEKDINLVIALKLQEVLIENGYAVLMTREDDSSLELRERSDFANEQEADLFISLHQNCYAQDESVNGIEVYYNSDKTTNDQQLAQMIQEALINETGAKNRGIRSDTGLVVTRETKMPAVLVETAFISNDYELDEKCNKRRPSKVSKKPVRKESRNARRTNRRLKEWFNPNVAVEDLTDALEIINNVATNAQRSDDFSSAKPITAVATQLKSVINSLKIK